MRIRIEVPEAQRGEFSKIKLCYNIEDEEIKVNLNINFKEIYLFTKITDGASFDFFLICSIIYGVDVLILRKDYSINGWSRELEISLPVENPDLWNSSREDLENSLNFLTGDIWTISFEKREETNLFIPKNYRNISNIDPTTFNKVSLFSGGLDSLVGVIDQLNLPNNRLVFASHYDSKANGPKSDQRKVEEKLRNRYSSNYCLVQTRVDIDNCTIDNVKIKHENTFRSRSLLFISLALILADNISDDAPIMIPENGTIALNHPLTPSRRSSCSTRTAHPYYLSKLNSLLSNLGFNHIIQNEYEYMTKGEMLAQCTDRRTLITASQVSCSCAKRGTRKDYRDVPSGTNHCGVCMPCLYRRAAMHKINIDNELFGTDLFNPIKRNLLDIQDLKDFLDYLKTPLSIEAIEKNLLVNGSLPLDKIRDYALVIERTRAEIKDWIRNKGNRNLQNLAGV